MRERKRGSKLHQNSENIFLSTLFEKKERENSHTERELANESIRNSIIQSKGIIKYYEDMIWIYYRDYLYSSLFKYILLHHSHSHSQSHFGIVCGQAIAAKLQEIVKGGKGRKGQVEKGDFPGQCGGRQDLCPERDPEEERGPELSEAGESGGRGCEPGADGRLHAQGDDQHEWRRQGAGPGNGLHEPGKGVPDHGQV